MWDVQRPNFNHHRWTETLEENVVLCTSRCSKIQFHSSVYFSFISSFCRVPNWFWPSFLHLGLGTLQFNRTTWLLLYKTIRVENLIKKIHHNIEVDTKVMKWKRFEEGTTAQMDMTTWHSQRKVSTVLYARSRVYIPEAYAYVL